MPRVTSLTPHPKNPNRFILEADNLPTTIVSLETIAHLHLEIGSDLEPHVRQLEEEAAALATYDRAVRMLAARGRSRAELRRLLIRKGESAARVDAAIERLAALGLLDDRSFARSFVRSRVAGPGLGRRRLSQELARRGVERRLAEEAIDEVMQEEGVEPAALLERVARRKLRSLTTLDAVVQRRRLYAHLARRGYDADEIRVTIELVLGEGAEEQPVD